MDRGSKTNLCDATNQSRSASGKRSTLRSLRPGLPARKKENPHSHGEGNPGQLHTRSELADHGENDCMHAATGVGVSENMFRRDEEQNVVASSSQ